MHMPFEPEPRLITVRHGTLLIGRSIRCRLRVGIRTEPSGRLSSPEPRRWSIAWGGSTEIPPGEALLVGLRFHLGLLFAAKTTSPLRTGDKGRQG